MAHPASSNLLGWVSLQKPVIILCRSRFEGGEGGKRLFFPPERERTGRYVECTPPCSYSGAMEGRGRTKGAKMAPPAPRLLTPPRLPAPLPPCLLARPLLSLCSPVSPFAFFFASVVVGGDRVLTWHGCGWGLHMGGCLSKVGDIGIVDWAAFGC